MIETVRCPGCGSIPGLIFEDGHRVECPNDACPVIAWDQHVPVEAWLSTAEVAEFCDLSIGTISSYRARGQMPEPERRVGRAWLWRLSTIDKWRHGAQR